MYNKFLSENVFIIVEISMLMYVMLAKRTVIRLNPDGQQCFFSYLSRVITFVKSTVMNIMVSKLYLLVLVQFLR